MSHYEHIQKEEVVLMFWSVVDYQIAKLGESVGNPKDDQDRKMRRSVTIDSILQIICLSPEQWSKIECGEKKIPEAAFEKLYAFHISIYGLSVESIFRLYI